MIEANVPRGQGLDKVVTAIVSNENPLLYIAENMPFFPCAIVKHRNEFGTTARELVAQLEAEREEWPGNPDNPIIALESFKEKKVYAFAEDAIRDHFYQGLQDYYFVDVENNAYNPSFILALFPEETTTIQEKEDMIDDFTAKPWYQVKNYEQVKTIMMRSGVENYLVAVPGEQKINVRAVADELEISKKHMGFAKLEDVEKILGEIGGVSPLIYEKAFDKISSVLVAQELVEDGYSKPHYNVVLDKKSALVVSDLGDVMNVLDRIDGYPEIRVFENRR